MRDLIDSLRREKIRVTIHDMGTDKVDFVLAVVVEESIDIWYVASIVGRTATVPKMGDKIMYFPTLKIDTDTYDYLCA